MRTGGNCRTVDREISRFPRKERLHMPGSSTTPGRSDLAMVRPKRVAFRTRNGVGTRGLAFAAWLAYALPYRRFVAVLADANARLGADVDRYSFLVVDLHHLLLAGLPAHFESHMPSHAVGLSQVRSPRNRHAQSGARLWSLRSDRRPSSPRRALWHQLVTARFGDQDARVGGAFLDLLPQPVDVRLEGVSGDLGIVAPDFLQQGLTRYRTLASTIEISQDC